MGKIRILVPAVLMVTAMLLTTGAGATTSAWFATSGSANKFAGDTLSVETGKSFDLALWYSSDFSHNTADFVVGYDKSTGTKYGNNIGAPQTNKLSLVSSLTSILATIDTSNTGWTPAYDSNGLPIKNTYAYLGSARETTSPYISGRVYGFDVFATDFGQNGVGSTGNHVRPGNNRFFSFTMNNNMAVGDSTYVIISNAGTGASWTSALKAGAASQIPSEYALKIVSVAPSAPVPEPSALLLGALGLPMIVSAIRRRK